MASYGGQEVGRTQGRGSARVASVGEAGRVHVVVRSVREAPRPGEERQSLGLLQHHLQLLEVLQPRHVLVLAAREETRVNGRLTVWGIASGGCKLLNICLEEPAAPRSGPF